MTTLVGNHTKKKKAVKKVTVKKPVRKVIVKKKISKLSKAGPKQLIRIHFLASKGFAESEMYKAIGISERTWIKWKKATDDIKKSIHSGRSKIDTAITKVPLAGRPSEYKPDMCADILDYFNVSPYEIKTREITMKSGAVYEERYVEVNDLPLLSGFAVKIGVTRKTLSEWAKLYPDFSHAFETAKEIQDRNLNTNGLRGLYNNNYANLLGKNYLGFKDKKDITTDDKPLEVKVYEIPVFNNNINEPDDDDSESDSTGTS